jgi:hypothetical protein
MKPTLFLLSTIVTLIMSTVAAHEINHDVVTHGTAVIAAKSQTIGGHRIQQSNLTPENAEIGNRRLEQPALVLPPDLTPKQGELLTYAYKVASEDGHKHPEYYQGLIYQESKAGGMKGYEVAGQEFGLAPMKRYYGVTQMKLSAAKDVLKQYPVLGAFRTDEEIIAKLITDDKWAVRMGSKYLLIVGKDKSPAGALVAYNKGVGGAKGVNPATNDYAVKIIHHAQTVVKYVNQKNREIIQKFRGQPEEPRLAAAL